MLFSIDRSFLKLAEEDYHCLPKDVSIICLLTCIVNPSPTQIAAECLVASVLCVMGVVSLMGKFMDIKLSSELNSQLFETVDNRLGFITFNHRTVS